MAGPGQRMTWIVECVVGPVDYLAQSLSFLQICSSDHSGSFIVITAEHFEMVSPAGLWQSAHSGWLIACSSFRPACSEVFGQRVPHVGVVHVFRCSIVCCVFNVEWMSGNGLKICSISGPKSAFLRVLLARFLLDCGGLCLVGLPLRFRPLAHRGDERPDDDGVLEEKMPSNCSR